MKKTIFKYCIIIGTISILIIVLNAWKNSNYMKSDTMRSANEIVKDMGVGWNLGNSLDSKIPYLPLDSSPEEFETGWGNPITTKDMIDKIKEAGFKTIRIPITWGEHMDSSNNVNPEWMDRVQEIVDYCIDDGLYVIINVHHDDNWCIPTYEKQSEVIPKIETLWKQIAKRFADYDDYLIFETFNEPRLAGIEDEWNGGTKENRDVVNKYNKAALKAIRSTKGNNSSRCVILPTYAASASEDAINDYEVPNDKNIIASIHTYSPYMFSMNADSNVNTWGSYSDKIALDSELDYLSKVFKAKGVPLIIGEFGSINKDNTSSRAAHAESYVEAAQMRDIPCIWWDNNKNEPNEWESFGLFNRNTLSWYSEEIKNALMQGYKNVHPDSSENDN